MVRKREAGFTLIEMLVAMGLASILLTLGAFAARHYWFLQSLYGSRDEVVTQLRRQQEQVVSESHPLVFGARFRVGSEQFGIVRFDPLLNVCRDDTVVDLHAGTRVTTASFAEVPDVTAKCRTQISGAGTDEFVFFFSRGTATEGNVTIHQPALGRSLNVTVLPLTGRVVSD